MIITTNVALEVAAHEAVIREAYKDSVGVWTWSVGLTNASGHNVERYIGKPQSLKKCLEIFVWALDNYADDVREAFAGFDLSEAEFAAALSFHWNTGGIKRASWVDHWKKGNIGQAKRAFMAWNKPKEIIGRRNKELDLFFDGVWSNNGTMTEYTELTSRKTPVWRSAVKRDVADILSDLLDEPVRPADFGPTDPPEPKRTPWWKRIFGADR